MKLILALILAATVSHADDKLEANKKVVKDFYDMAFTQKKPAEAMKLYGGPTYKQHNPHAPDGKEAFVKFFEAYFKTNKETSSEIKRVVAEGDLVVVHVHMKADKKDRGSAVVDIFRVENGKLTEHWDVMQGIPATMAHSNTMF